MSLRPSELALVTEELTKGLRGAQVQKAFSPDQGRCYLQLHYRGETSLLCLSAQPQVSRISIARSRPPTDSQSGFQRWLRDQLVGSTLVDVRVWGDRVVALSIECRSGPRKLVAQCGAPAGLFLLGDGDRILAVSSVHPDPGGWKVGSVYAPKAVPEAASRQPPRLVPVPGARFPWAEAAEALYGEREGEQRAQELRRQLLAPLKRRLARLARTLEKVTVEAARGPQAEEHRRIGELITRNLDRLERGMKTARLIEYGERGAREVEVSLQPDRTPKQQAEWHFHQYRRFSRGSERAAARLKELGLEAEAIQREIEQLERLSPEKILAEKEMPSGVRREAQRPKSSGRSRPYKEYFTVDRQPIWVGRDARGNERLTFHLAQPNDLWLHARGGSGSHVVVPLDRKAEVPSQLLVDAAHLALHHSSFKGEPRGEVAYTRAKYVRRQKGGAAGSVILIREKTFVVRIDQATLARLLDSRTDR